ncbi:hypothetical protein BX666DRAFT_919785 [Dichotomocladium elegans]|nr:hypothetical protein BX666DRAFT_919785 [Dichotomocladium elegans]
MMHLSSPSPSLSPSPKTMYQRHPNQQQRSSSTFSSLDLPPILDMSPKKTHCPPSTTADEHCQEVISSSLPRPMVGAPAFLEPTPQLENHRMCHYESAFRPWLFAALKEKLDPRPFLTAETASVAFTPRKWKFFAHKIPTLQIPVPRRSFPSIQPRLKDTLAQQKKKQQHKELPKQHVSMMTSMAIDEDDTKSAEVIDIHKSTACATAYSPMSPTMATASAAAAAAAVQHHPGSTVAESFLECLRRANIRSATPPCSLSSSSSTNSSSDDEGLLVDDENNRHSIHHRQPSQQQQEVQTAAASTSSAAATAHEQQLISLMQKKRSSSSGMDHSKFLTKNAHIKRPRNAWIHFRCHYGQALKTQDPTLRAEEISKRASRRWGRLTEKEKKPWHDLAEQEKLAHKEAFPEYRYCPKRHSSSSTSSTSSTVSSPTSLANGMNQMHFQDMAGAHPDGDTSGHRCKKKIHCTLFSQKKLHHHCSQRQQKYVHTQPHTVDTRTSLTHSLHIHTLISHL